MDKNLIEKYKQEMLLMYQKSKVQPISAIPVQQTVTPPTVPDNNANGSILAFVTTLRAIYPIEGAKVTIFTGNLDDMQIIATGRTDQSGKSPVFSLPAPPRNLSESPGISDKPYSSYNMMVQADGYLDNIHLNIPVFSGVQSVQRSNMMLTETAGENKGPQIFDEGQQFDLN